MTSPTVGIKPSLAFLRSNDVLRLGSGVFKGGNNCNIIVNISISIIGSGAEETVIDCELKSRCLTVNNGASVNISGITFRNGEAPLTTPLPLGPKSAEKRELSSPRFLPARIRSPELRLVSVIYIHLDIDGGLVAKNSVKVRPQRSTTRDNTSSRSKKSQNRAATAIPPQPYQSNSAGGCVLVVQGSTVRFANSKITGIVILLPPFFW